MKERYLRSLALVVASYPLLGCHSSASSADSTKQLLGTWRQEKEFNGPEKTLPLEERVKLVCSEKTYEYTYPATKAPPFYGSWSIKSKDAQGLLVSMTMKLGAKEMPLDDKRIKIIGPDVIEVRNSKNGSGGVYKRAGSAAETAGLGDSSAAVHTTDDAVAAVSSEGVCETAVRCCQAAVGETSPMCGPLAKSSPSTCERSLASFEKAVKASNPSRAADCEAR